MIDDSGLPPTFYRGFNGHSSWCVCANVSCTSRCYIDAWLGHTQKYRHDMVGLCDLSSLHSRSVVCYRPRARSALAP